jgi:hypothetical protein
MTAPPIRAGVNVLPRFKAPKPRLVFAENLGVEGFGYGGQNVVRIVTRPMLGEFDGTTSVVDANEEVISPTVGETPTEFGALAVLAATEFLEASIKQLTCEHAFSRPVFS